MITYVLGCGAMGALFGGSLAGSGDDVRFIEAAEATIAAVREHGLDLVRDEREIRSHPPIGHADSFSEPGDVLMVFTKSQHTAAAVHSCRHLLHEQTLVVTVQNGLGNAEAIREAAGTDRVIAGMTTWPADVRVPGKVASHGDGVTRVWNAFGSDPAWAESITTLLNKAGMSCVADPEVQVAVWEKVAFNAALNALCALVRVPVGVLGASGTGRELAREVVQEAIDVAQAHGIRVDAARVNAAVWNAFEHHANHQPSMLQDLLHGRQVEVDAINGEIYRRGEQVGVAAPLNHLLLRLLETINESRASVMV